MLNNVDKDKDYRVRLNAVINYVSNNLDKTHSIEQLAERANFSKFHFHRIYTAVMGETIQTVVRRLRLEGAAATLVYQKDRPITEVALDHGYSSGANFTKAFTKHFGYPPTDYRIKKSKIGKAKSSDIYQDSLNIFDVKIKQQPEIQLAYLRRTGAYLHMQINEMHQEVQQWVDGRGCGANNPTSVGITWSDSFITEEENWIYDACVAVQPKTKGNDGISIQTLSRGTVATLVVELSENDDHDLSTYWDWLVRVWFLSSHYELRSSPSFELYFLTADGFKVQLCLPLESTGRRM